MTIPHSGPSPDGVLPAAAPPPDAVPTGSVPAGSVPADLGVVIVTFNAADVILDCLESLLAAPGVRLRIVVGDNASSEDTVATLRNWASGAVPYAAPPDIPFALAAAPKPVTLHGPQLRDLPGPGLDGAASLTLLETGVNGGFAAGVNHGLAHLAQIGSLDRFWVLNPDSVVPPATPAAFARHPGGFALMGGRVNFLDTPDRIQIDGGLINRWTGITGNVNLGASHAASPPPDPARLDFITGASMVASRAFYEAAGPMAEEYFLYYEEVDWALRRGALPLAYCPQGIVYHRAGTAIGSPRLDRMASPFSIYFKHRGRMRFMRRFHPAAVPAAYAYSFAKAAQIALQGYRAEARALVLAALDRQPPAQVRARLSPEAAALAFAAPRSGDAAK